MQGRCRWRAVALVVAALGALLITAPASAESADIKINNVPLSQITDPADLALAAMGERLGATDPVKGAVLDEGGYQFIVTAVDTMDPGCDVTSSTPDGYDLCGATNWPDGDTVSAWNTTTYAKCWAGMQERDVTTTDGWRAWAKCHMIANTYIVPADWYLSNFTAWKDNGNDVWSSLGSKNVTGYCGECYWTGVFRTKATGSGRNAVSFSREYTIFTDTYSSYNRNCVFSYAFDWGSGRIYDPDGEDCDFAG
jgi:hypothetical protein